MPGSTIAPSPSREEIAKGYFVFDLPADNSPEALEAVQELVKQSIQDFEETADKAEGFEFASFEQPDAG